MISEVNMFDYWDVLILIFKKLSLNISENTDFFSKYRPNTDQFQEVFLKKSVLQTKLIFTDHCVFTAVEHDKQIFIVAAESLIYDIACVKIVVPLRKGTLNAKTLIILNFTNNMPISTLSGGKPKRNDCARALALLPCNCQIPSAFAPLLLAAVRSPRRSLSH